MQILIVDDQAEILKILSKTLLATWPEATLYRANHVRLALQIVREKKLDLLITDWQMPEWSGLELLQAVKQLQPDLPVIMCTGQMTRPQDLETALAAGAVDYLRKPIEAIELVARVKATLRLSASYQQIKQLNTSKDVMFSMLAHQLSNDTAQLSAALDLIQHAQTQRLAGLTQLIQEARTINQCHQTLILQLLQWSRLRFGDRQPDWRPWPLRKVLEQLLQRFQHPCLRLRVNRQLILQTDLQMLEDILVELLKNAVAACPEKEILVLVTQQAQAIRIEVRDQGPGPLPQHLAQLLNPVFAPEEIQTIARGLGLKICHELLHLLNSQLQGSTAPGEGTRFWFDLPTAGDDAQASVQ